MAQQLQLNLETAPATVASKPAQLKAGDLVCSNCGEPWPGKWSGFWRPHNGGWYHWCHGGRPGLWHVARPTNGGQP